MFIKADGTQQDYREHVAKHWSTPDQNIQRIYLGDQGYIEQRHVGGGRYGWSDEIKHTAAAPDHMVKALADRLGVEPTVNGKMFERFSEEQYGWGSLSKKEQARRAKTPIVIKEYRH